MPEDHIQFKSIYFPTMKNALLEHQRLVVFKFPPIGFACIVFSFVYLLDHKLTLQAIFWIFASGYLIAAIWAWWLMEKTYVYAIIDDYGMNIYTVNQLFEGEVSGLTYEPKGLKSNSKGFEFVIRDEVIQISESEWPEYHDLEAEIKKLIGRFSEF